ncbi:ATP-binding protein [Streptomyces sp. NPDC004609]|uniref:ATP-binding protein n=1 Tax=Streptomyces sp. NPDC004609 TaxID=3364704 RepID=UPI0036ABDA6C
MKPSAAKTLGVAVLGAAFAASAAGAASAHTAALPDTATSLDTVTSVLPVQETLTQLPAGAESLAGGQAALAQSASTVPGTLQGAAHRVLTAEAAEPAEALLGGLPAGDLTQGLPTDGLA